MTLGSSRVQAFTRVSGPCFIGRNCLITTDRIAGCAIGEHSRIHGELSTSIVIGHANKSHDGCVGHSVIGRWVNLGAGTHNSDLRNDYGEVTVRADREWVRTGLRKVGCFIGDHTKTAMRVGVMTLAAGTAWARVEAKKHFPSDVLAGAALGNFIASFVHDAFLGLADDRKIALWVAPSRRGLRIGMGFDF